MNSHVFTLFVIESQNPLIHTCSKSILLYDYNYGNNRGIKYSHLHESLCTNVVRCVLPSFDESVGLGCEVPFVLALALALALALLSASEQVTLYNNCNRYDNIYIYL